MRAPSPVLALLLAPALLAACAGTDDPEAPAAGLRAPAEHGRPPEAGGASDPYGADPELAREVAAGLDAALAPGAPRDDLQVFSECWLDDALYQVEVFGSGVGVWNGERQFEVGEDRVTRVLELLREARFGDMREVYGEAGPDIPTPQDLPPGDGGEGRGAVAATRVLCLVSLRIGEVEKQTIQISKPPRSEELQALAESIFELTRGPAESGGVTADGLDDGLAKVADGTLAPETLALLVQRKPEPRDAAAGADGFLLRLDGGRATVRDLEPTGGFGPPRRLDLSDADIAALAARLAEARIGEAPPNLWAEHYTDVVVEVLDREQRIQARRFARMTPTTHGEAQVRYDAVYRELAALAGR